MIIVIEGMDGVGKSTVAKEIARRLGMRYVDGLLINYFRENGLSEPEIKTIRKAIDLLSDNENSILRTWIYGFANLFNMMHYKNDLIIDRHCLTTYFFNGDKDSEAIFKYMIKITGKPDLVILLRASVETRRSRICNRNRNDLDLGSKMKMSYGYDKMEHAAELLKLNYYIVDTDGKTSTQILEEVMDIIKEVKP